MAMANICIREHQSEMIGAFCCMEDFFCGLLTSSGRDDKLTMVNKFTVNKQTKGGGL